MPEGNTINSDSPSQRALASALQRNTTNLGNAGYFPTVRPRQVGIGYQDIKGNNHAAYVGSVKGSLGVGSEYSGECIIM